MDYNNILQPNSEFERKQELNKYLSENVYEIDKQVLRLCTTQDDECIGMIGCILKDDTLENKARILIASKNIYHESLSEIADELLKNENIENLVDRIAHRFLREQDDLTEIEDNIYYILMSILKNV